MTLQGLRGRVDRILLSPDVFEELEQLRTDGTLTLLFPELEALIGFGGEDSGHKDLWEHTKRVVAQTKNQTLLRWAALFHDVGKPRCFARDARGKISFHHHEAMSAKLFAKMAARVQLFTPEETKEIKFLVYNLGHVEAYEKDWTDSAVRRLRRLAGEHFDGLLALARADITTKHANLRQRHHERMKHLRERAEDLARQDAIPAALPTGLGEVLSQEFGVPPSQALGDLMKALKGLVEAGTIARQAEAVVYVAYIRAHPQDFPGVKA
jgi:poly(A) polymerase